MIFFLRLLFGAVLLTILLLFGAGSATHTLRVHVVQSGSMAPVLSRGSVVITRALPPSQYRVGDIVVFKLPAAEQEMIVHRLTSIYTNSLGTKVATTKGDANTNGDPWTISLGAIQGKSVVVIPWLGYLLSFFTSRLGFMLTDVLGFMLVVAEWWSLFSRLYGQPTHL